MYSRFRGVYFFDNRLEAVLKPLTGRKSLPFAAIFCFIFSEQGRLGTKNKPSSTTKIQAFPLRPGFKTAS